MKIDPDLLDYVNRTEIALKTNPPCVWPAYACDPIASWRYFARIFGHGLAPYQENQICDIVKTLYGRWFIAIEMRANRPNIDNGRFVEWILDAYNETKTTPPVGSQ